MTQVKSMLKSRFVLSPTWLRFLIIVLLLLGVFFRFVNLDRKVYWHDEAYTSLRISGYTMAEVFQQVFDDREIGIEDLQKYQHLNPEKGLIDTIKSLAVEDPQHPPLYYVLLRFWVQRFGTSIAAVRSLTALISLLVFPCIYWLCQELFESSLVGLIAIALIAVSPIHILFAQEAREYCLWTVTILLSSASLLQAMRLNTKLSWGIYAATVALGLYTFLFSGFVAIGHGVYVVLTQNFRLRKKVINYLIASSAGVISFSPWLLVIFAKRSQFSLTTEWTNNHITLTSLMKIWLLNLSHIFIDVGSNIGGDFTYLLLIFLVGYSIYFLCRRAPMQVWLFILTLMGTTALCLILPDLITGGIKSSVPRYLFPCYLGIQLAVAYLLATQMISASLLQKQVMQLTMFVLLSAGIISCTVSSQAETWWNKEISNSNPQVARIVNQAIHPLLLSNNFGINPGNIISLSYLLEQKVRLRLVVAPTSPQIHGNLSEMFLFDTFSGTLLTRLEQENKYKVELVRNLIEPRFDQLWVVLNK